MGNNKKSQKGQALILIALGIVGLVGITALAIDGGNIFAQRRHAQNAADTASLAGALEKVNDTLPTGIFLNDGDKNGVTWKQAALNLIADNLESIKDIEIKDIVIPTQTVDSIEVPNPGPDCSGHATPYDGNKDYVQVLIKISVKSYFAQVVGRESTNVCVDAIARANPPSKSSFMEGNAISVLAPHACPAFTYNGNADTSLIGGGIFINSDGLEKNNCGSFFCNSSTSELIAPNLTNIGKNQNNCTLNIPKIEENQTDRQQPYPPNITWPDPVKDCGPRGTNSLVVNGNRMGPAAGQAAGNWDDKTQGKFPPTGVTYLDQGLYCIYSEKFGFDLSYQDSLFGNNITLAVIMGGLKWTGSDPKLYDTAVRLYAPKAPDSCTADPTQPPCYYAYNGLLIYLPLTNSSDVTFNGNSDWDLRGTVLAPASFVTIDGTNDSYSLNVQIIAYTAKITGTANINFNYDDAWNWDAQNSGILELSK
jgi:hypothetical protein